MSQLIDIHVSIWLLVMVSKLFFCRLVILERSVEEGTCAGNKALEARNCKEERTSGLKSSTVSFNANSPSPVPPAQTDANESAHLSGITANTITRERRERSMEMCLGLKLVSTLLIFTLLPPYQSAFGKESSEKRGKQMINPKNPL